jgi:cysteine desulfurase
MSQRSAIYLDSNAAAPLRPEVSRALAAYSSLSLGNPSSIHASGRRAKRIISDARYAIARSLGKQVDPEAITFCSSGSEANQWVIRSALASRPGTRPHWITSAVEHDCTLQLARTSEEPEIKAAGERNWDCTILSVDQEGRLNPDALREVLRAETRLVSFVWVNNETGVIQDPKPLIEVVRSFAPEALVHVDAAQVWGKIQCDLSSLGADYVTFSSHKIGAPPGVGLIWTAMGARLCGTLIPGKQEKGRRGGTENVLGIHLTGVAAAAIDVSEFDQHTRRLRDLLEKEILKRISGVSVNGAFAPRASNTSNLSFSGIGGDGLVMALDLQGFCVSAGSACSSGVLEPSHVLLALGLNKDLALSSLRISVSSQNTEEEVLAFIQALEKTVLRLRSIQFQEQSKGPERLPLL